MKLAARFFFSQCSSRDGDGFTRLDLTSSIIVCGLLAFMSATSLGDGALKTRRLKCLDNLRQLGIAWQVYAQENGDRVVTVNQGLEASFRGGWISGWMTWDTSPDNTNTLLLTETNHALLAPYLNHRAEVFKCPDDVYLSVVQMRRGFKVRVRSYSANGGVGGNQSGPWNPIYKRIRTLADLQYPGPAETYVFLEEHPDSINDGAFYAPWQTSWVDSPAAHHEGAGGFAFADGHAVMHAWEGSLLRAQTVRFGFGLFPVPNVGDADVKWVAYRAGRVSDKSY